jgi:anti-sigma factor RsiW
MTCPDVLDRLDDYVDGGLSEAEFQELELHLATCAACRDEEQMLRAVLAEAAALPHTLEPPRDLWPAIADRISARPRLLRFLPASRPARSFAALAAAAVLAVALAAILMKPAVPVGPDSASGRTPGMFPAAVSSDDLLPEEQGYVRATSELLNALAARRDHLSPETLKVVDQNLTIIDQALEQVREALRKDPGNHQLTRMLTATHQRKVDVLRHVVSVSS